MDCDRVTQSNHPRFQKRTPKIQKCQNPVERFQAEHNPADLKNKALWIDYARDDDMKRQMNVIEKKKGVNAILLGIFEEVGAWTSFPTMGVDYLALLLSTHLKRDARFRLTRFLLHNGCNPIRIALWYKTRGMLIDHSARLDVKALLDAFPHPYNPDIKNYPIPGTVSRRTAEPNFERIVDEHRWCTSSLTGGFTYANGIMDDILARAVSILMYNSNAGEAGRFSVPPGDHLSLALGGSTARVEKAIEVYERSRDRFAALLPDDQFCDMNGIVEPEEKLAVRHSFIVDGLRKLEAMTEAPSEPYDGLKWIVDLAMIPPSPPCSPPGSPTPPASPMRDVEEDPPPLSLPPSALSFLADVSGFKAEFDDRTASLQAAVIAAQKERDDESAALKASVKHIHGTMELVVWTFEKVLKADVLNQLAEKKLLSIPLSICTLLSDVSSTTARPTNPLSPIETSTSVWQALRVAAFVSFPITPLSMKIESKISAILAAPIEYSVSLAGISVVVSAMRKVCLDIRHT